MKKQVFLFLALLLPVGIFIFLKIFGKNEFAVEPLYVTNFPAVPTECPTEITLPYTVADSLVKQWHEASDSLTLLMFTKDDGEAANQMKRVAQTYGKNGVGIFAVEEPMDVAYLKNCILFLKKPYDLVLVDKGGVIRGEYIAGDREDIDRLLMEIAIILKKY